METKTQISQWGNSLGFSIPTYMAESLNLKANDTVICRLENGKIVLEPIPRNSEYTLDELLAEEIEISEEIDWGKPEGEEIL